MLVEIFILNKKQQIWSQILQKTFFFNFATKHWLFVLFSEKNMFFQVFSCKNVF